MFLQRDDPEEMEQVALCTLSSPLWLKISLICLLILEREEGGEREKLIGCLLYML